MADIFPRWAKNGLNCESLIVIISKTKRDHDKLSDANYLTSAHELKLSSGLPVGRKTYCIVEICNIGFRPAILLSTRIPKRNAKQLCKQVENFPSSN